MADATSAVRALYDIAGGFRAISASLVQLGQDAAAATPAVEALAAAAAPLQKATGAQAMIETLKAAFQKAGAANVNAGLTPEIQRVFDQVLKGQTGMQELIAFLRRIEGQGFARTYGGRPGDPSDPLWQLDQTLEQEIAGGGFLGGFA